MVGIDIAIGGQAVGDSSGEGVGRAQERILAEGGGEQVSGLLRKRGIARLDAALF